MNRNIVRQSKYRHVYGTANKAGECYTGIKVTRSSIDSSFCAVNPKFVAIITQTGGGGSFLVLPLEKFGRLSSKQPHINGHTMGVVDLAWSPFDDYILASCSEDCKIKIWEIPENGIDEEMEAFKELNGHERKITLLSWHPVAEWILLSGSADNTLRLWHALNEEELITLTMHTDIPYSVSWSYDGSRIATTCKDKTLRVIDVRKNETLTEIEKAFDGSKPSKCIYLKDGRIFAVGFSKMSGRLYALFDPNSDNPDEPLTSEEVDQASGTVYPYYDPDTNIIYTAGKGDSQIRYYEVNDEDPYIHFLSLYSSASSGQRGVGYLPKRGCDVTNHEVARFYKLYDDKCEPIAMTVPRKSDLFQRDIYPPFLSDEPGLTAEQWMNNENAYPKTSDWEPIFKEMKGNKGTKVTGPKKTRTKTQPMKKHTKTKSDDTTSNPTENGTPATEFPADFNPVEIMEAIKKLNATVRKQNRRIAIIEAQIGEVVAPDDENEEE